MTVNDATTYLKYANLQLAAEAIDLQNGLTKTDLSKVLQRGNDHSSRFTTASANDFASKWQVVATQANTNTGFSGTLFVCTVDDPALGYKAGEQVISFRSTEFVDDAVRDSKATNELEIKEFGWAFGQIDDMKKWVDGLFASGKINPTAPLDVTGYSLGGSLATAFNLLYPAAIRNTYTFNGAGIGIIKPGNSLTQVIADFDRQRVNADGQQNQLITQGGNALYQELRAKLTGGVSVTEADFADVLQRGGSVRDINRLATALTRINLVLDEVERVSLITNDGPPLKPVDKSLIDAAKLDYQFAAVLAGEKTDGYHTGIILGGWSSIGGRNIVPTGAIPYAKQKVTRSKWNVVRTQLNTNLNIDNPDRRGVTC
jgi:pimeloyl-ACP methyl ester carboxylesterase